MFATVYLTKWHQSWIDTKEAERESARDEDFQPDLSGADALPEETRAPQPKRRRHDDGAARGKLRRQSLGGSALNVDELDAGDTLEGCLIIPKEQVLAPATTTKTSKGKRIIAGPFECSAGQVDAKVI